MQALGWTTVVPTTGGDASTSAQLRLADLVVDPAHALAGWLPQLALSDLGPEALRLLADAFTGSGANQGVLEGTGHPDDPYRFALADGLPNIAVWFPPAGLERRQVAAPEALQQWRPGDPGLSPEALASALAAEATVADDVRALIDGRDIVGGLDGAGGALGGRRRPHRAAAERAGRHHGRPDEHRRRAAHRPARPGGPDGTRPDDDGLRRARRGGLARCAGRPPRRSDRGGPRRDDVRRPDGGDRRLVRGTGRARCLAARRQHHRRHPRAGRPPRARPRPAGVGQQ